MGPSGGPNGVAREHLGDTYGIPTRGICLYYGMEYLMGWYLGGVLLGVPNRYLRGYIPGVYFGTLGGPKVVPLSGKWSGIPQNGYPKWRVWNTYGIPTRGICLYYGMGYVSRGVQQGSNRVSIWGTIWGPIRGTGVPLWGTHFGTYPDIGGYAIH